jgi:hypothetical protein
MGIRQEVVEGMAAAPPGLAQSAAIFAKNRLPANSGWNEFDQIGTPTLTEPGGMAARAGKRPLVPRRYTLALTLRRRRRRFVPSAGAPY